MKASQHTQTCKHVHTHTQRGAKDLGPCKRRQCSIHRHANTHTRSVEQKIGDPANEGNSAYTDMQTCTHTRSVEQKIWDRKTGLLGVWGALVESWLDKLLPDNAHELCRNRVTVVVTTLPDWQQVCACACVHVCVCFVLFCVRGAAIAWSRHYLTTYLWQHSCVWQDSCVWQHSCVCVHACVCMCVHLCLCLISQGRAGIECVVVTHATPLAAGELMCVHMFVCLCLLNYLHLHVLAYMYMCVCACACVCVCVCWKPLPKLASDYHIRV